MTANVPAIYDEDVGAHLGSVSRNRLRRHGSRRQRMIRAIQIFILVFLIDLLAAALSRWFFADFSASPYGQFNQLIASLGLMPLKIVLEVLAAVLIFPSIALLRFAHPKQLNSSQALTLAGFLAERLHHTALVHRANGTYHSLPTFLT